jgi:hypothetical protein
VVENFKSSFLHILDQEKLDAIARESKFLIRKRKLTPKLFLDLSFYGLDSEVRSLRRLSNVAFEEHSLEVSKQAIDKRYSRACVSFVKALLKEALSSQVETCLKTSELQQFKTVRIKDSTRFGIHESLSDLFEGYGKGGGRSSKAGLSIQYEFDIKTNRVFDIDVQSAVTRDSSDAISKKEDIGKGDLIIRDLGYYSDQVLEQVINKEAFLISRLYHTVTVYNQNGKRINFHEVYRQMQQTGINHLDIDVTIGKEKRPVRLVIEVLPDQIYQHRITQRNKENKSRGYTTSDEFMGRAHFNLFICNISRADCSWETISKLYRLRWQIELVFKVWKSILHVDCLPKMNKQRFLCSIYLKLLWIFINWKIVSDSRNHFFQEHDRLLSITKCFQTLNEKGSKLRKAIYANVIAIEDIILEILLVLQKGHWIENRKNRQNFEENIQLLFCKSII